MSVISSRFGGACARRAGPAGRWRWRCRGHRRQRPDEHDRSSRHASTRGPCPGQAEITRHHVVLKPLVTENEPHPRTIGTAVRIPMRGAASDPGTDEHRRRGRARRVPMIRCNSGGKRPTLPVAQCTDPSLRDATPCAHPVHRTAIARCTYSLRPGGLAEDPLARRSSAAAGSLRVVDRRAQCAPASGGRDDRACVIASSSRCAVGNVRSVREAGWIAIRERVRPVLAQRRHHIDGA